MRVIVVNDKKSERLAIGRVLQQVSHSVETFVDEKAAVDSIAKCPPEVLVLSWPRSGGADRVRLLRGADTSGQMYVLALLDATPGGGDIPQALGGGANDVLRRPIVDTELVARVQAPMRLLRWAKSVTKPVLFDFTASVDVARLAVWRQMGEIVTADLAQMFGEDIRVAAGSPSPFGPGLRGATIPMSLASDQVELRVSIVADPGALRWLGGALLGDPNAGDAGLSDVLRELANTAGGAVKRAALLENVTLTTGIPANDIPAPSAEDRSRCWTVALDGGKASLAIVGEIRSRENERVAASKLREGMVLVHDLRSPSGALLVASGTRITSSTATRLAQVLGPRFLIEVACTAPSSSAYLRAAEKNTGT